MTTQNTHSTLTTTQIIVAQIAAQFHNGNVEVIHQLIEATNPLKGCKFVSMSGYSSDASENTEVANHVVNFGFNYENMKESDISLLGAVVLSSIDVDQYNYQLVNPGVLTLDEYKRAVRAELPTAFAELVEAATKTTPSTRENNDFYLNKVLVYNTKTLSLSVIGQGVSKNIIIEGEQKIVKKGAKTVAKELIKKAAKLRTNTYRRFKIANLSTLKISGETIEIL